MAKYSTDILPNEEAIIHFKGKPLLTSYSYLDVKSYEHALAFTVAKMMDEDLLKETRDAILSAMENGTDFRDFKRTLMPYLMAKGWLAPSFKNDNVDDDKETFKAYQKHLGRRLRTIFHTNMHSSYSAGQWQRIQETKEFLPYLQYMPSVSAKKRDNHKAYYGLVRPVDDDIWQSIFPPNGFGCKCWVKQLTKRQAEKIGISDPFELEMETVENRRTGEKMTTPKGVHFSFAHNHDRLTALLKLAEDKHGTKFGERLRGQVQQLVIDTFSKLLSPDVFAKQLAKSSLGAKAYNYFQKNPDVLKQIEQYGINEYEVLSIMGYTHGHGGIQRLLIDTPQFLRRNLSHAKIITQQFTHMMSGLAKLPNYAGQVIRRVEMYNALQSLKVGDVYHSKAFMSATITQPDVFIHHDVRLIMQVKTAKLIEILSIKPHQREVIVLPNTTFKVLNIEQKGDDLWITMSEI